MKRCLGVILLSGILFGCGSPQPEGNIEKCSGDITLTEKIYDVAWSPVLYVNPPTSIGQYFQFRNGLKIKEIMVEPVSIGATSLKVSIYKTSMWNDMTSDTQPIKTYEFPASALTQNSEHEVWIQLPEIFEVPATSEEDQKDGILYFIDLQPVGGNLVLFNSPRDELSQLRAGTRQGSSGSFGNTDTTRALDMGFRGQANCQSSN